MAKFQRHLLTRRRRFCLCEPILVTLLFLIANTARASDFLYDGKDASPVIEYVPDEKDEHRDKPSFLYGPNNGNRIVSFYSPSGCPHCRLLRDHYISMARKLQTLTNDMGLDEVKVYTISCFANSIICSDNKITGVPRIFLVPSGATSIEPSMGIVSTMLHPFIILNGFGYHSVDGMSFPINAPATNQQPANSVDQRVATRTKRDVFNDAHWSFYYSLRHEVFKDGNKNGPLPRNPKAKLRKLLELLKLVLPPSWSIKRVINAILDDFATAAGGKEHLDRILDDFPPPVTQWSQSCSKGLPGQGHACGIWNLFHITTIGVVEFNNMTESTQQKLIQPTEEVGTIFRSFVGNFLGCQVCHQRLVADYTACALDRCKRLSSEHDGDFQKWIELPVWLLETHNVVNVRLMKEKAEKDGRTPSLQDERDAQWPPRSECLQCWLDDGALDKNTAFKFLRLEYWPEDKTAARLRKELAPNDPVPKQKTGEMTEVTPVYRPKGKTAMRLRRELAPNDPVPKTKAEKMTPVSVRSTEKKSALTRTPAGKVAVAGFAVIGLIVLSLCLRKKLREKTGHHKKVDGDEDG